MFLVSSPGLPCALVEEGTLALPEAVNAQDYAFIVGVEHAMPSVALWRSCRDRPCRSDVTTDRLMLTVGTSFAWDVYKNILRPSAPDKEVLLVSKVAIVLGAGSTLLLAINPPEMLAWLIWMGIGVMLATFAVPLLAGLYWRGATKEGAIASMAVGLISAVGFGYWHQFVAPLPMHFSLYALVISISMIVVSPDRVELADALDNTRPAGSSVPASFFVCTHPPAWTRLRSA